jgi:hypothetical protein
MTVEDLRWKLRDYDDDVEIEVYSAHEQYEKVTGIEEPNDRPHTIRIVAR